MQLDLDKDRLIRSARLGIAVLLGLLFMHLTTLPHSVWIVITVIVVLFDQSTVGGTLQRGILRITATIISAVIALIMLFVFNNNPLINEITVVLVTFIYAYLFIDTKQSYIGILGSVTIAMILLMDTGGGLNTPIFRASAIIIGVLVAIATMLLFFPQYAKKNATDFLIHLISQLENMMKLFTNPNITLEQLHIAFIQEENKYISKITKINRLIDEAQFEIKLTTKTILTIRDYKEILLQLRRLHRLTGVLVHHLDNNELRFDKGFIATLEHITHRFEQFKLQLIMQHTSKQIAATTEILSGQYLVEHTKPISEYTSPDDNSNNSETLFIQSLLKHIINELDILSTKLFK